MRLLAQDLEAQIGRCHGPVRRCREELDGVGRGQVYDRQVGLARRLAARVTSRSAATRRDLGSCAST
jgi:hypothetical protein